MSLLEILDFRTGKGASGMFLVHHLDGSQKLNLLKDQPGDVPCGPSSQLRGNTVRLWGMKARPALLKQSRLGPGGLYYLARIITGDCEMR